MAWLFNIRKDYSPNNAIWPLCRQWAAQKHTLLQDLNDGSYHFSALRRYEFDYGPLSLWASQDMIALKLITQTLQQELTGHIPPTCYHIKGHGSLKKAVQHTQAALADHTYVLRSDVKDYYASIRFSVLDEILEAYNLDPILLSLVHRACVRTETEGGNYYDFHTKGLPKGSPLSPLLGAVALLPLDIAMGKIKDVFYARYMDDWVVLTKSKTALRKVIKCTRKVLSQLHLQMHPMKTYIGKISHGFNFLGYFMDGENFLPSTETMRRFHERSRVLYEHREKDISPKAMRQHVQRDTSLYQVNEAAPRDETFTGPLQDLLVKASRYPATASRIHRYIGQWSRWLKLGLTSQEVFIQCVNATLPSLAACWSQGRLVPGPPSPR